MTKKAAITAHNKQNSSSKAAEPLIVLNFIYF